MSAWIYVAMIVAILLTMGGITIYFSCQPLCIPVKEVPVNIELAEAPAAPIARVEIRPEVYKSLSKALELAFEDLKMLQQTIPCYLSAPRTMAIRLGKSLSKIECAIGSIEINGYEAFIVWECPNCHASVSRRASEGVVEDVLCPECAAARGASA